MPPIRATTKALTTALTAALLLAAATSTATARHLSVSNTNIRATWSSLAFTGAATIRCRVTLEGSLHARTFIKSRGTLVGAMDRMDSDLLNCTGGRFSFRQELLPGHITYEGSPAHYPT